MTDKNYCMSAYLALRFIEKEDVDFCDKMKHRNVVPPAVEDRIPVKTATEIDDQLRRLIGEAKGEKLGIFLSGGMDSAILATYMKGCDAYTFRFLNGGFQKEEMERAEYYARKNDITLHYVDIDWSVVEKNLETLMSVKCAPVHSIEPQIYEAAMQAKSDGITTVVVGELADTIFGGLDGLLSQDWDFEPFMKRYVFTSPEDVLNEPVSMQYLFERYRIGEKIDFQKFMEDVFLVESLGSYFNSFRAADMKYLAPYSFLKMGEPLDLKRIRNGESKYLIRELFKMKYPEMDVPQKLPMPRPVDQYLSGWSGPTRSEFKKNLDMTHFTGNQKWQLFCLEKFLDLFRL